MVNQMGKFRRFLSPSSKQHPNMYELLAERDLPPKASKPKRSPPVTVTLADSAAALLLAQRPPVIASICLSPP